ILSLLLFIGLAGLRLIKVSIPSYKMRGESTFMECQYELNRSKSLYGGLHRNRNHHSHGQYQQQRHQYRQYGGGHTGGSIHYDDNDDMPQYRRTHTYPQQTYKQQRQQQQQQQQYQYQHRQPYFQAQIQTHKALWQDMNNIRSRSSNGATSYHQPHLQYPFLPQKQKRQYNPEYPTLPPSPYGHSVYRGRSQMSSNSYSPSLSSSSQSSPSIISSSSSSSGSHTSNYGGRVGASTYTGRSSSSSSSSYPGNPSSGVFGSSGSYGHHDDNFADSNERKEHIGDDDDNSHEEDEFDNEADSDADEDEEHDEEEGEDLYAIKWYKDNEEFYRFVPKANPPKTSYRVDGVRVIEEHSDSSRVLLRGLTINSTGLYRCEISAEAPSFASVQGEGQMDVVYLPRDGPHIKGQQFQYQIGEILNLNCSSGKSHPASHLQWFINDQP
ncbi:transcription factor 20-like, partial [Musca vetustissima]|uniref:transcription factor 20-like n=1 Tax=Musca vetustissima TaxID=27455 RepID=UPI002AB7EE50